MRIPELRPHQRDAVDALTGALAGGGRAQVVMAMGTGKTLVGRAAAERLLPGGGIAAVLVPSLALVSQTLRAWRETGVTDVLAVCSAGDPGDAGARAEDTTGDDLGTAVTTGPEAIAAWLAADDAESGIRLLLATYHSVPRVADAYGGGRELPPLGLIVFDEAHRAAADPEALFATALHDARVPAVRRLFLTATPRLQAPRPDDPQAAGVFEGMSDSRLFGPRVFELGVAEAIRRGLLSDFKVVVVGVSDTSAHRLVLDNAPLLVGPEKADARTVAVQVALAQAAREYRLRRILVFRGRVAASREFASLLAHTAAALPARARPEGPLTVRHVDSGSTAADRERALADLDRPPGEDGAGWTVVSNVRVLGEGVDCPALDCVVFADPRDGQIGTVQAVGRALRLHPGRDEPAVILIPVCITADENGDAAADDSAFRSIWQVLRLLREHDVNVGAQLAAARRDLGPPGGGPRPVLPDWIDLRLPAEAGDEFLTAFTVRVLDDPAVPDERGLARLREFAGRYGHASPAVGYADETGFRTGQWAARCRTDRARGVLDPDLAAGLEALPGWTWSPARSRFERMLALLRDYAAGHGNTRPPRDYRAADGSALGQWTIAQRREYREGRLGPREIADLEGLPGWSWENAHDWWGTGLAHLREFAGETGHADVREACRSPDGYTLGAWVQRQRRDRERMPRDRAELLEQVPGWGWTGGEAYDSRMLAEVARYIAAHGPGHVPKDYRPGHDPDLPVGTWTVRKARERRQGRMDPGLEARFEAIGGFAWGQQDAAFREVVRALARYADEHGAAAPPRNFVAAGGLRLGERAAMLRTRHRDGVLPPDRAKTLERLPGWSWGYAERPKRAGSMRGRFESMLAALRAYAGENGTAAVRKGTRTADGSDLWTWTHDLRRSYRQGTMPAWKAAAVEEVPGWRW